MNGQLPIVIAEAGVNHNGSINMALKLVDAAVNAGADFVKFQTFKTEKLVAAYAQSASYQKKNCGADSQFEMLKNLELSFADFIKIKKYCDKKEIGFLSTAFDLESLDFLISLGISYIKVPSGEITNLPMLEAAAESSIPVILSTGMSSLDEVSDAVNVFLNAGYGKASLTLLHCTTQYPTPFCDVNLRAMETLHKHFNLPVGLSDHTKGIEVAIGATVLGASVIEKHFTLDKDLEGPDHAASLNPKELKELVKSVRNVYLALGSSEKISVPSEQENILAARKSIVASIGIKKGEIFSESNLTVKRPGSGISPMRWHEVIGSPASRDFKIDELIEL